MVSGRLQEKKGYFYIVLNYKDTEGKRKEPWFSTGLKVAGNKRKAEKKLLEFQEQFDPITGMVLPKEKPVSDQDINKTADTSLIPFGDYLKAWVEVQKHQVEESTYAGYWSCIHRKLAPYFDERKIYLQTLTPKVISEFYAESIKSVKANTVKHYHAYLRKALKDAVLEGLIPNNPADRVRLPKIDPYIGQYYNQEELKRLFHAVKGKRIEFPVLMAAYYGLRRSEIAGLKWSAVDFNYKTLTIRHTVTSSTVKGKYKVIRKDRAKTKKSLRTLPLFESMERFLLEMKAKQKENRKLMGNCYHTKDEEYIFVNEEGDLIDPGFITQNFAITLHNNKLRKIRFHDLRHSCATLLRHNGVRMEDIQKWLGHSNITTTEKIYAHFEDSEYLYSAEKISKALDSEIEMG